MVIVTHGTRIGVKAIFKNEANLQAIAEVFNTLHTPTRTGTLTGFHAEAVTALTLQAGEVIRVNGVVGKARIHDAIKRHRGGRSATHGGHSRQSNQCLFHDLLPRKDT